MKVKKILSSGKLLTLMKIGFTQIMIAFVICGVSMAHDNHAQVLDKEVSISVTNVPLEQVLNELSEQAHVKFAYGLSHVNLRERITIKAEKRSLKEVLNELLTPLHIGYKVHEKEGTIALRKQEEASDADQSGLQRPTSESRTPTRVLVSGRVTTVVGEPLAGVNIIVKGTTTVPPPMLTGGTASMQRKTKHWCSPSLVTPRLK